MHLFTIAGHRSHCFLASFPGSTAEHGKEAIVFKDIAIHLFTIAVAGVGPIVF